MKKRGKIFVATGIAATLLLAAYLFAVMAVMPDFYRKRLPEALAARVTGAGLFSVRLENLEFDGIPVEQAVIRFRPGRRSPCGIVLNGVRLNYRVGADHEFFLNGVSLREFLTGSRRFFAELPVAELRVNDCSLSGGPVIQLDAKFYSPDGRCFDATLKSVGRGRPFLVRLVCGENNPEEIKIVMKGNYSLPVLLEAMREFGIAVSAAPAAGISGDAGIDGYAVVDRGGGIVDAHLTADLRNVEISNGDIRLRSGENAMVTYIHESGRKTSLEIANVSAEAPFRLNMRRLTVAYREHAADPVEFSGQLELIDGQATGVKLTAAANSIHTFGGTYAPANGFWTVWSESGKTPAEMLLNIGGRLVKLGGVKYEWSGNGRNLRSGDFSLSLMSDYVLVVSASAAKHSFSGVKLNLNANFNENVGESELRGDFTAERGEGEGLRVTGLKGTAAVTGGKNERIFNGLIAAAEFTSPLGGKTLAGKNLALNTEARLDEAWRIRGGGVNGGLSSLAWDIFTLDNPRGTAGLEQGKINASIKFDKFAAGFGAHKFFSPEGMIQLDGTRKDNETVLKGSLETAELWYLGENLSGKLDHVGLTADFSAPELAMRLNAAEGNAEGKSGRFRSGKVSASYSSRYDASRRCWETRRLLSGIQFQNLEWNSEKIIGLFPMLYLAFDYLTIHNAELTVGALQLQKISLQQHLPGVGRLDIGALTANGRRLGALSAGSTLNGGLWQVKGSLAPALLNKAPMNFAGSVAWTNMIPGLTVSWSVPDFSLSAPIDPGVLNPAWKGLEVSGQGGLSGEFAATPAKIGQKLRAGLKNIAISSDHWAMDGVKGELEITDLEKCLTAPHQQLTFANMIIGGCELSHGALVFHAIDPERFLLEHASFESLGGRVSTAAPVTVNPAAASVKLPLQAEGISLPRLLFLIGLPDAAGQAEVGGSLPVRYQERRVHFDGARLTGYDGLLQLRGLERFNAGAPRGLLNNGSIAFIQAVLQDFIYRNLKVTLEPGLLGLQGRGRPAANVPYRYDAAGQRFVKAEPIDGIGFELELNTEIRLDSGNRSAR